MAFGRGDSGPTELPLVVGRDGGSNPGVVDEDATAEVDATPKMGALTRLRRGVSWLASSLCSARRRFPNGEFFSPDIVASKNLLFSAIPWIFVPRG